MILGSSSVDATANIESSNLELDQKNPKQPCVVTTWTQERGVKRYVADTCDEAIDMAEADETKQ